MDTTRLITGGANTIIVIYDHRLSPNEMDSCPINEYDNNMFTRLGSVLTVKFYAVLYAGLWKWCNWKSTAPSSKINSKAIMWLKSESNLSRDWKMPCQPAKTEDAVPAGEDWSCRWRCRRKLSLENASFLVFWPSEGCLWMMCVSDVYEGCQWFVRVWLPSFAFDIPLFWY